MAGPYNTDFSSNGWSDWLKTLAPGMWTSVNQDHPDQAWDAFVTSMAGSNPASSSRQWLNSQYNNTYGQYTTAADQDPTLTWTDYLTKQFSNSGSNSFGNQYSFTDPYSRSQGQDRPYAMDPTMRMVW